MSDGLAWHGLSMICETCESDIDFPDDDVMSLGVCRQCGIAFLLDAPAANERVAPAV
ncbi:MAG: hypothetical protein ACJ71Z_02345 [Aeromicrobium sp.]